MYDLDDDQKISKEELLAVLTMMVGANISTEQLISIAERTIMEADTDKVSKDNYQCGSLISLFRTISFRLKSLQKCWRGRTWSRRCQSDSSTE